MANRTKRKHCSKCCAETGHRPTIYGWRCVLCGELQEHDITTAGELDDYES